MTDDKSVQLAADSIESLDILVNNAGVIPMGNILNGNALETLDANWAVNVRGLVAVTEALIQKIIKTENGAIVSLSSMAGLANMPIMETYSATKSAVHSLMQGIRSEMQDYNVLVTTVYPGPVDTDMTAGFDIEKASPSSVADKIVLGIENGDEEIFPDPMAMQNGPTYFKSPKELERQFGGIRG